MRKLLSTVVETARWAVNVDEEPHLLRLAKTALYIFTALSSMAAIALTMQLYENQTAPLFFSFSGFAISVVLGFVFARNIYRLGYFTSAAYAPGAIAGMITAWLSGMLSSSAIVATIMFCIHLIACYVAHVGSSKVR